MTKPGLPWQYRLGWFLVVTAVMLAIPIFVLSIFEEQRGSAFVAVILPLAVLGGAMIAYQHCRNRRAAEGL
jgi:hypothetical protein